MSQPPGEFYTQERWQNWLDRIEDEEIDPEEEESARLLLNLQDDAAIAVAKIIAAHEDGDLDEEMALKELRDVREVVLADADIDDDETLFLVSGVQTSLVCVFYTAEAYIIEGAVETPIDEAIRAAVEAAEREDTDAALDYAGQAGTRIVEGEHLDRSLVEDLEYGIVTEWVNGLDSLESALEDPEVIEPEDEDADSASDAD